MIYVAGTLYVQALAVSARADAARAQQRNGARRSTTQAVDLKQSGLIAGIDVLRAEVQLNTQTQRATIAANEFEKAKLQLARVIGLPLGQKFALDPDAARCCRVADMTLEQAVARAYADARRTTRPRSSASAPPKRRARRWSATRCRRCGSTPTTATSGCRPPIRTPPSPSPARCTIPIFQGGRTRGRLLEADADLRSRRAEAEDLKASIYYEVRAAFLDLDATIEQLARRRRRRATWRRSS